MTLIRLNGLTINIWLRLAIPNSPNNLPPYIAERGITVDLGFVEKVVEIIKERANFVSDFWEQSSFFFTAPQDYDEQVVKKRWKTDSALLMIDLKKTILVN